MREDFGELNKGFVRNTENANKVFQMKLSMKLIQIVLQFL